MPVVTLLSVIGFLGTLVNHNHCNPPVIATVKGMIVIMCVENLCMSQWSQPIERRCPFTVVAL